MDILVVCPDSYDRWAFERVEGHRFHFVDAGISHWEASPEFDPIAYPAYLKPPWLKLGLLGFKVTSDDETRAAMELARHELPAWTQQYYRLFERAIDLSKYPLATTDMMLVEEFVEGRQVTVEGWSLGGAIRIWAMTDTNTFPGTRVIDNFSTPSRIDAETAETLRSKTIETIHA